MSSDAAPVTDLTVVVACNGAPGAVERCLDALVPQLDGAALVVCEARASDPALRSRHPAVVWLERPGELVPGLWRDGIRASRGRAVALTISPMVPADDWVERLRAGLGRADVVGGAIEPGEGLRAADRAEHLSRYARDMLPFEEHDCLDLPGDNAAYPRALLDEVATTWEGGFWEPDVHRALADRGARLLHDPTVIVRMGRSSGFAAFVGQRWRHGRAHGGQRGARLSRAGNALRVVAAPVVPAVLMLRTAREVLRRGRHRSALAVSLPALLVFDVAWAAGEAAGHLDALRSP